MYNERRKVLRGGTDEDDVVVLKELVKVNHGSVVLALLPTIP